MNRLGVFLIYDRHGIVDDYIVFLLEKMKKLYSELVIICNCDLNKESRKKIGLFSSNIIIRENKGFDAGGFKDALSIYIGWKKIKNFDELILFNDSFFGPFFSIEEIFKEMDKTKYDFWSMTKNTGSYHSGAAIQSYFIVVRKRLLKSPIFQKYWEDLPYYESFKDVVVEYEMKFASYFSQRGFTWNSYIKTGEYDVDGNRKYRMSLYHTVPNEIIKEQRYPFLKRKLFDLDAFGLDYGLDKQTRENFIDAIEYIKNYTEYDINLIWKNVLRTYSLRNIQDSCCLRKIIDYKSERKNRKKIKIALWLCNQKNTFENLERFLGVVAPDDIVVGASSRTLLTILEGKYKINSIHFYEQEQDFWKYIINNCDKLAMRTDVIGFFNDHDCYADENEQYVSKTSYMWSQWENMFGQGQYIDNIRYIFDMESSLGMLVTPRPMHAHFFSNEYVNDLNKLSIESLQIKEYVERNKFVADWSECFWIRKEIIDAPLRKCILELLDNNISYVDLARAMPYICQKKLFYTSVIESLKFGSVYEQMQQIYLRYFLDRICGQEYKIPFGKIDKFLNLKELYMTDILEFVKKHNRIFIYGCGEIAELVLKLNVIKNIKGFIVSDGTNKLEMYESYPVYFLSELQIKAGDGVIVALNDKNTVQVRDDVINKFTEKHVLFFKSGGLF